MRIQKNLSLDGADCVLITPTHDRPAAFRFCERWITRQTFRGTVLWVVVDDGEVKVLPSAGQVHVRRLPGDPWSLQGNLLAAAPWLVGAKRLLIIEDDDWYSPRYVEEALAHLEGAEVAGAGRNRYYHLRSRRYLENSNHAHSSLCSTAVAGRGIEHLLDAADRARRRGQILVDMDLWDQRRRLNRKVWPGNHLVCGLKGYPGSRNLCPSSELSGRHQVDLDGAVLRAWVGEEDAAAILAAAATWPP